MKTRLSAVIGAAYLLFLASATAQQPEPDWRIAARAYLDVRMAKWLEFSHAASHGGGGTKCISCHTAVPMAIARPRLGEMSASLDAMLENIRQRVARWNEIAAFGGDDGDGPIQPFYNLTDPGTRRSDSMATESVLNAFVLTHADPRGANGALSDSTRRALTILWSTQNDAGSWYWLNFNLRPWERDAEYLGAAWKTRYPNDLQEQATQFRLQVLGPIGKQTIRSILEPLGFTQMKEYMKQEANGDWLSARSYIENGEKFLLIYNETELGAWRRQWKAHLKPGEPTYKPER